MSESEHLANALIDSLLEDENGWFLPVFEALEGLSAEQAARSPGEKFNSPWRIVRHMAYWTEVIKLRLEGKDPAQTLGEDWGALPDPGSEKAWAADKHRLESVTRELAEIVRGWDTTFMDQSYRQRKHSHRQVIQGLIGHNCYHTNEVISMRHMLGYWLEET
jgi:uncharacterized damage-inducible protein DinB